jgi:hypothetical protein
MRLLTELRRIGAKLLAVLNLLFILQDDQFDTRLFPINDRIDLENQRLVKRGAMAEPSTFVSFNVMWRRKTTTNLNAGERTNWQKHKV